MEIRKPATEFSRVWYANVTMVLIASLPLGLLGWVPAWDYYMSYLVVLGLGFFAGPELVANVVNKTPQADSGYQTHWVFWKLNTTKGTGFNWGRVGRVLYGVWVGVVLFWRLPDIWYIDNAIWFFFQTWLPYHFWEPGLRGPWEWLFSKLGKLVS